MYVAYNKRINISTAAAPNFSSNIRIHSVGRWFNKGLFVFPSRIVISVEGKSTLGEECYVAFVIPRFAPEQQIRSIRELW